MTYLGCPVILWHLSLAMRIWIFTKVLRFAFGNGFTFHLEAFTQSPFPGVKNRFELVLPDRFSDLPDRQKKFFCGLEFLPGQGTLQLPKGPGR
jgi:hypothetical protein